MSTTKSEREHLKQISNQKREEAIERVNLDVQLQTKQRSSKAERMIEDLGYRAAISAILRN